MMRTVTNRIDKLEDRLGIAAAKRPCTAVVISLAGWEYALSNDRCVEILRESGSCRTALFSSRWTFAASRTA